MPHPFEFPRMLRSVVPLMSCERRRCSIVGEFIAFALGHFSGSRRWLPRRRARLVPGLTPIVGTLDDLPEPAARLRCVNAIRIGRRSLHVIDLPAGEEWTVDVPFLALAIRCENECAFSRAYQDTYSAHLIPSLFLVFLKDCREVNPYARSK